MKVWIWVVGLAGVVAGCGSDAKTTSGGGDDDGDGSGGGGQGAGQVGDSCTDGTDCVSGVCVNLQDLDDGCQPLKFCTTSCTDNAECTAIEGVQQDCDAEVCLYEPWWTSAGCS